MTLLIAGLIGGAGAGMLAGCALTLRSRAFGNFSAALALSACTPPPGDCLLVNHVVYSCEEVR